MEKVAYEVEGRLPFATYLVNESRNSADSEVFRIDSGSH